MRQIPKVNEIRDEILSDLYTAKTSSPILPRRVWTVLATAIAGSQYLLYRLADWLHRQIFTSTMDAASLERRGAEYGMTRTGASIFLGTAAVGGDEGAVIPAGWLWEKGGQVYQTTAQATVEKVTLDDNKKILQATLIIKSLQAGSAVTLQKDDTINTVSPLAGVDDKATVTDVIQSAADAEDLELFRTRIMNRQRNIPQGGAIADFVGWALEVPGVTEAFVRRFPAGTVNVYPLKTDANGVREVPDKGFLGKVHKYLNDPVRSPFGRDVKCLDMTERSFKVEISDLIPDTTAMKVSIGKAVKDYFYERRPSQYTNQPDAKNGISTIEISGRINAVGAKNAVVKLTLGKQDLSGLGYTLKINELASFGGIKWV